MQASATNASPEIKGIDMAVLSAVLGVIQEQPRGKGVTGKEIVVALRNKRIEITEETLRKHYVPKLKELHGIKNSRSRGGYHPPLT
jgi:hypothetical protein